MDNTIEKLRAGDEIAWQAATKEIRTTVRASLHNEADGRHISTEDLEEVGTDAAVYLHSRIGTIKDQRHLRRCGRKVARNRLLDRVRKVKAQKRACGHIITTDAFDGLSPIVVPSQETWELREQAGEQFEGYDGPWSCFRRANPRKAAERNELKAHLEQAIEKLDCDSQKYIRYRYYDDLKSAEIAERMKVGMSSVGNRVQRAVTKLGDALGANLKADLKEAYFGE